ncbi:MAG: DUF1559 domain-containing protein [Planctomycetaceae bacterium]
MARQKLTARRAAFTLVELLVVIAIIGILIGLLLPGVQAAREAARRMTCQNHLKQIGLALHNYSTAHGSFPSHTYYSARANRTFHYAGWVPQILPYFEEAGLADLYDYEASFYDPQNQEAVETKLPMFECPSTPNGVQLIQGMRHRTSSGWLVDLNRGAYASDYAGNRGYTNPVIMPGIPEPSRLGMFDEERNVGFRDVTDGTSHTVMVIESAGRAHWYVNDRLRSLEPNFAGWHDYWAGTNSGWMYGFQDDGETRYGPRTINASNKWANPYAFHGGGLNAVLTDGSVRFMPEQIDAVTFFQACSRAGGESPESFQEL